MLDDDPADDYPVLTLKTPTKPYRILRMSDREEMIKETIKLEKYSNHDNNVNNAISFRRLTWVWMKRRQRPSFSPSCFHSTSFRAIVRGGSCDDVADAGLCVTVCIGVDSKGRWSICCSSTVPSIAADTHGLHSIERFGRIITHARL